MYKYRCKSVGDCSKADRGELTESESKLNDPHCEVCGQALDLIVEPLADAGSVNTGSKKGLIAGAGLAALAVAGIGGWFVLHSNAPQQESDTTASAPIPAVDSSASVQVPVSKVTTATPPVQATSQLVTPSESDTVSAQVSGGIAPTDAETSSARRAADDKLGAGEFSEAEKKSARAATLEMIKTAVAKMGQSDLAGAESELMQAKARDPSESLIYYNLAIVRIRQKQPDEALNQLEASFKAGFAHFDAMDQDHDLDPLRTNPKFKELIRTYQKAS